MTMDLVSNCSSEEQKVGQHHLDWGEKVWGEYFKVVGATLFLCLCYTGICKKKKKEKGSLPNSFGQF